MRQPFVRLSKIIAYLDKKSKYGKGRRVIKPETPAVSTLEKKFDTLNELAPKISDKNLSNEENEHVLVDSSAQAGANNVLDF